MNKAPELVDVDPMTFIASVGTVDDHTGIPPMIIKLLDEVWAHIRDSQIEDHGHNIVLYRNHGNELTAGVQVPDDTPEPPAPLVLSATPGGRAARLRHVGPYSTIPQSVQTLFEWCNENGHEVAEPSWEVYGDWEEDESKLVTDIHVTSVSH